MKKIFFLLFILFIAKGNINASPRNTHIDPRATFDKMWVDYDITEDGVKGMRLHFKFTVYEMKGIDAYVAVYFEYENGNAIRDKNGKFASADDDVAAYKSIKPAYDPSVYDDLQLFMPYSELDLEPGKYNLTMDVKLIKQQGGTIQKFTDYDFEYTKPGTTTTTSSQGSPGGPSTSTPGATYDDLWVDYDVTQNGKKGMRIHVKYSLLNMKNTDCYIAIYFSKKNGDKLKGTSSEFRSTNGQAAVFKSLKPAYDEAVFEDTQLFIPYSELNSGKGKVDLKMEASIIYKNGDLLKQLTTYDFWLNQ